MLPFYMVYAILNGMNITIDKAGRIVVPKEFRQRLACNPTLNWSLSTIPMAFCCAFPKLSHLC